MKLRLVVAEMADISPMCSIMEATAMGAMTRMEVTSNLHSWKLGRPTQLASATEEKLRMAEPSGLVTPKLWSTTAKR